MAKRQTEDSGMYERDYLQTPTFPSYNAEDERRGRIGSGSMVRTHLQQIAVTDWIDDTEEKFPTSFGELNNREWLQMEKKRIGSGAPLSSPVIRVHPKYFDKDSHGRYRTKVIALFRYIDPAELQGERGAKTEETPFPNVEPITISTIAHAGPTRVPASVRKRQAN